MTGIDPQRPCSRLDDVSAAYARQDRRRADRALTPSSAVSTLDRDVRHHGAVGLGQKTTFVHALAGIVPVSAGEIRFGDTLLSDSARRKRDAWRHAACGMVFQDFRLIEELDIFANVILPATFSSFSVQKRDENAGACDSSNGSTCPCGPASSPICHAASASALRSPAP